jgi:hypothetical protein
VDVRVHPPESVVGSSGKSLLLRALGSVAASAPVTDAPLPVIVDGEFWGWAWRDPRGRFRVWRAAWSSYSDIVNSFNTGKEYPGGQAVSKTIGATLGVWYDLWSATGPPTGTYAGAANTAVAFTDATTGAMRHGENVSPSTKQLTSAWLTTNNTQTTVGLLADRVLTYEACTISNVSQNMNNAVAAPRYAGAGVQIALSAQTATGATASQLSVLTYRNQSNAASTIPVALDYIPSLPAAGVNGARIAAPAVSGGATTSSLFLPLAAGDSGVLSITNFTSSANNTGTLCFALVKPLAWLLTLLNTVVGQTDQVIQFTSLPIVADGACLQLFALSNRASVGIRYRHQTAWG